MKKHLILAFSITIGICCTAYSCINEETILLDGSIVEKPYEVMEMPKGIKIDKYRKDYEKSMKELYDYWKTNGDIAYYSDYGVALIYLGEYEKAKSVFVDIDKLQPGRYSTAANIGTIYELLGMNDSAYYWINRGLEINPLSHDSSEWVHLNILRAKMKGGKYLESKYLIGTDFGDGEKPITKLSDKELKKLMQSLFYQVKERMTFIKPKNQIIGQLLFEMGNITALRNNIKAALLYYKMAWDYGYDSSVFKKRREKLAELQRKVDPNYEFPYGAINRQAEVANTEAKSNMEETIGEETRDSGGVSNKKLIYASVIGSLLLLVILISFRSRFKN